MTGHSHGILRIADHVHFGTGSRDSLAPSVRLLGRRAVMVVDPFLATTAAFQTALDQLRIAGVETIVSTDVVPELPVAGVEAAAESVRFHDADVVVGFGGGSALDQAKLVALLLRHPGPLSNYYGENRVPGPILPIVAVPTTAGTGSEVTPVAVVSDPERALKVGISDPHLIPRVAIVDPGLTLGAPQSVTAHSGIDALVHAVEAFTARPRELTWGERPPVFVGSGRLTSLLALEAVAAIGGALPRVVRNGLDVDAREQMAWGSMLAGMAFGTAGTHLSHALQYPIGALTHTPHGLGTGLMLPFVLQACLPGCMEQLSEIAAALGVPATGSTEARAQGAIERISLITANIGLPPSLAAIGVEIDQLPRIAELAAGVVRLADNSPVSATPELLMTILHAAYQGKRETLP